MIRQIVLFATVCGTACAQGVPAGSDWSRVQALPVGTKVHLKASHHAPLCTLKHVEPDGLTCEGSAGGKELAYTRAEIKSIQLTRRGVSSAVWAGLGAGVGVASVAISAKALNFTSAKGSVYAGGAGLGAVVFAPIGFFTDPLRGPLVYKAP